MESLHLIYQSQNEKQAAAAKTQKRSYASVFGS